MSADPLEGWKPKERDESKKYLSDDPTSTFYVVEIDHEGHPVGKKYSVATYNNYGCRCTRCRASATEYARIARERREVRKTGNFQQKILDLQLENRKLREQLEKALSNKGSISGSVDEILSQNTDEEVVALMAAAETEIRNRDDLIELLWELCDE